MGRTTRTRAPRLPNRVEKVELSDKHLGLRAAAAVFFLILGASALAFAFTSFINGGKGWREIEVNPAVGVTCADDFVLMYDVGSVGSVHSEGRALTAIYSDAAKNAYEMFNADVEVEGRVNMRTISLHPNEELTVDPELYEALSLMSSNRLMYLGPAYGVYGNIFYLQSPEGAVDYDPELNPEVKAMFERICGYASNSESIDLELLGDCRVILNVSEEYLEFCAECELDRLIDFGWLKNAFIADYIAEKLIESGYTNGTISSYDGYVRNLDNRGDEYTLPLYHAEGNTVYPAAVMRYSGSRSIVYLRNYMLNAREAQNVVVYGDGSVKTRYLDPSDGLNRVSLEELIGYSETRKCAEIALTLAPAFISEEFDESAVKSPGDIYSIYFVGTELCHTDPELKLDNLYDDGSVRFTEKVIK